MIKNSHLCIKFCIAMILLVSVVVGYWPHPEYIIELTCISNFSIGLIFLFSGIRVWRGKKDYGNVVYSTAAATLILVFMVCMGSLSGMYHMNFKGAFVFLHVVNPILILLYYIFFVDEKKYGNIKYLLITPLFALTYLLCDYVIGTVVGHYVYGFFELGEFTLLMAVGIGLLLYLFLLAIAFINYGLNLLIKK